MTHKQNLALWRRRKETIRRWLAKGIKKAEIARRLGITRERVGQLTKTL